MIRSARIINFQSHKDTLLKFHKGVNVIIGSTDSGKSRIVWALNWLFKNRPAGTACFPLYWKGNPSVSIKTGQGDRIKRYRSKTKNIYRINDNEPFKAIKTDVPEEIQNVLNISDVNLEYQLDSHFMLSKSSGEVAQYFNKIADLSKIDTSIHNIESSIRSIEAEIRIQSKNKEKYEEELDQYNYLDKYEAEIEVLEDLEKQRIQTISKAKNLTGIIKSMEELQQEIDSNKDLLALEDSVNVLIETREKITELSNIIDELEGIKQNKQYYTDVLKLEPLVDELIDARKKRDKLSTLIDSIESNEKTIEKIKTRLTTKQRIFQKEMPEICPLCGRSDNHKH